MESPAPKGPQGHWTPKAALPLPRSEMAWATAWAGRMYIVGGYGEGRVDRAYHHVYDPRDDRWFNAAPLPRGANHVAVVADAGQVYALGGFINKSQSGSECICLRCGCRQVDGHRTIATFARCGRGGRARRKDTSDRRRRRSHQRARQRRWHEVYDPQTDKWEIRKALPAARDHVGAVAHNGMIHIIGGHFNTFEYNTDLHHVTCRRSTHGRSERRCLRRVPATALSSTATASSQWAANTACRTKVRYRKALCSVRWRVTIPQTNTWQSHAPMTDAGHAVGATTIGDAIYVAGGGAVTGGSVQSSVHEAFTLAA